MRATILTLGLAAGLFGTAGTAPAQYVYPGGYSAYNPGYYGAGRGPFYGGRYYAAPTYGYGYPAFGGSNYGAYNFGYNSGFSYPSYGYGSRFGGYRSGFRFGYSTGGFGY